MSKLFSTAYLPPISCLALMATDMGGKVYIEACESYQKQSYRNRCRFYAADGVQSLNVPVVHENGTYQLPIREIKIDYSTPWLIRTQRAIVSAYETSAYFDYYKDDLFSIMDSRPQLLFDLDMALTRFFLEKVGIQADIRITQDFIPSGSNEYGEDLREVIHPKRDNDILKKLQLEKPYFQVFAQKYGFISNLSIMDLLFNEGPESILYLKKL